MNVGSLVRWKRGYVKSNELGLVIKIEKDPMWVELQVTTLWPKWGLWTQSIKSLEVVDATR